MVSTALATKLRTMAGRSSLARALKVVAIWLPLWLGPVALLYLFLGGDNVFTRLSVFFSQVAVFSFGGAYAVLAYVAQQAVDDRRLFSDRERSETPLPVTSRTTPLPCRSRSNAVPVCGAMRSLRVLWGSAPVPAAARRAAASGCRSRPLAPCPARRPR